MEVIHDTSQPLLSESGPDEEVDITRDGDCEVSASANSADLTFINGLALVIGLQIGSGIFLAPSQISRLVPLPGAAVLLWLFAGLFVWTGAASFAELGLAIPRNGGLQEYLQFCYGDFVAFVFTCTWLVLIKPAAMAMIAIVFSDHLCQVLLLSGDRPTGFQKIIALSGLWLVTTINCAGHRTGPRVANIFLVLKICTVYSIGLWGLLTIIRSEAPVLKQPGFRWFDTRDTTPSHSQGSRTWTLLGNYSTAFYSALFCFGGWESVGTNRHHRCLSALWI